LSYIFPYQWASGIASIKYLAKHAVLSTSIWRQELTQSTGAEVHFQSPRGVRNAGTNKHSSRVVPPRHVAKTHNPVATAEK
jgi:hypothetical protein